MKSGTHPASLRYQALIQLLRTSDTLWNTSRLFFAKWDLSPSQFNVLNLLHGSPDGVSQTDLSRELIMHRSNVTGLVDRLQERGLVSRLDGVDRRTYRVVLTPEATRILQEILPDYYSKAEELWGTLSDSRLALLIEELKEAATNAERITRSSNLNFGRSYDPSPGVTKPTHIPATRTKPTRATSRRSKR